MQNKKTAIATIRMTPKVKAQLQQRAQDDFLGDVLRRDALCADRVDEVRQFRGSADKLRALLE